MLLKTILSVQASGLFLPLTGQGGRCKPSCLTMITCEHHVKLVRQ